MYGLTFLQGASGGIYRIPEIIIIIIIIMFLKGWACFLFLDPQDEVGPSISSSVVLCSFVLLVYIVVLVLVVCLCPSSVHVVATFGSLFVSILCTCFSHFWQSVCVHPLYML